MAKNDVLGPDLAGRANSPALSDTSGLTVLSRSPSPVPDHQEAARQVQSAPPLTLPSTPTRSRAADGRFTPRNGKRAGSLDMSSGPSKKFRGPRESLSPCSPTSPRSPRIPQRDRKCLEDAVSPVPKPVCPVTTPWVPSKGGCGTLEVLPKEVRQKIIAFAFDIATPVTVKTCCGPETTVRERGACIKHGSRSSSAGGRFNILQISKAMRMEASWVVLTQGLLLLSVDKALIQYLGFYRWNSQRVAQGLLSGNDYKARMWTSVSQFRRVQINICKEAIKNGDPTFYTNRLVEISFSLCQSWAQTMSLNITNTSLRIVRVDLASLFQDTLPFNVSTHLGALHHLWALGLWSFHLMADPDVDKMASDSGRNLLRLVSVVAKHRECSQWAFVANTDVQENDKCGAQWLEAFQAECAKHDMSLVDVGSKRVI